MKGVPSVAGIESAALKVAEHIAVADNTAAVVTIAADANQYHVVRRIRATYDDATQVGVLTIAFGATPTTTWQCDVQGEVDLVDLHVFDDDANGRPVVNEQCVITLSAIAATGGELCVEYV